MIFGKIVDAIGSIGKIVDDVITTDEERLDLKARLAGLQIQLVTEAFEFEKAQLEARSKVIIAEAQSESWITRSWRPITMLVFVALIVGIAFGWMDMDALERVPERLWTLLTIGIGGYMGVRGAEKIAGKVIASSKQAEEA